MVIAYGNRFVHAVNGLLAVDVQDDDFEGRPSQGFFALQIHPGPPMEVQFKDIEVKELTAPPDFTGRFVLHLAPPPSRATPSDAKALQLGESVYKQRCAMCHSDKQTGAPPMDTLAQLPHSKIVDTLVNGLMQDMALGLGDEELQAVATYLTSGSVNVGFVSVSKTIRNHRHFASTPSWRRVYVRGMTAWLATFFVLSSLGVCTGAELATYGESAPASGSSVSSARRAADTKYVIHSFRKIQLSNKFWAEGVAIADVNRDDHMDIISGPYWYEGPDFKKRHEIFPATQTFVLKKNDGTEERIEGYEGALGKNNAYSNIQVASVWDFNGDGWPDVLTIGFPGTEAVWYENPGPEGLARITQLGRDMWHSMRWAMNPRHSWIFSRMGIRSCCACLANSSDMSRRTGAIRKTSGRFMPSQARFRCYGNSMRSLEHSSRGRPWSYAHGLGYGDINGDGRVDVLEPEGWWEQPNSVSGDPVWKFHRWSFLRKRPKTAKIGTLSESSSSESVEAVVKLYEWPYTLGGAQIYVYDVNGDGLPDIVSSLNAHGHGLAWFEQLPKRTTSGEIQFKPHIFMGRKPSDNRYGVEFTQLHAMELADIDGDGLNDIVTGKRFWAHGPDGPDPETNGPAVLYWFRLVRDRHGAVDFVPHLMNTNSGVGCPELSLGMSMAMGCPTLSPNKKAPSCSTTNGSQPLAMNLLLPRPIMLAGILCSSVFWYPIISGAGEGSSICRCTKGL